jgi:hypothetical protein
MDSRLTRGFELALLLGGAVVLGACKNDDEEVCACPSSNGFATIQLCGAIVSAAADPDSACSVLNMTAGQLDVETDVAGTCTVGATFASGATASTEITFTSSFRGGCCGQGLVAAPATVSLGPCGAADAGED